MSRRHLPLLAVVVVFSLIVGACAPAKPQPTTAPEPTAAGAEPTQAVTAPTEGEVVTLKVWDFGGVEFEWLDSIIAPAFNEKYPNIKIEHLGIPESEFSIKLETAIAAGDVPDLAVFVPARLMKAGHVMPLDDFMAQDGFKVDDFFPLFKSRSMLEGKVYSLPANIFVWGMIYNKDLFKAANLPELNADSVITFDDWLQYARAINKPSDKLEERVWGSAMFWPAWNSMNNYMSDPFVLGPDGRQCVGYADNEDWLHAWEVMLTAYKEDLTPDSASTLLGEMSFIDLFKQGKLGMMYGTYGDASAARAAGINVGITGQPVVTKGWKGNVGGWATEYSIMAGSKHPKEAWLLLKFLATDGAKLLSEAAAGEAAHSEGIESPPCYMPLAQDWAGDDPLKQESLKLMERIVPPPFTPDIWTSVDPFNEAWRRMTEDGVDVKTAISEAAIECQEVTDDLWEEWEKLGQ